ncbi:hypothetical protein BVI434_2200013 [Burkholderia vietnamiensis]|nr:hypothetical protein BVI434_2200013 [Burkholderia vietnamiensis]
MRAHAPRPMSQKNQYPRTGAQQKKDN